MENKNVETLEALKKERERKKAFFGMEIVWS